MTQSHRTPTRAQVDVINFWCVAILIISAASVAGVVGAAVVTGEFEDRNFDLDTEDSTDAGVLIETQPDGTSTVRWSEKGEAQYVEIRVDDETVDTLEFVGAEATVESGTFEVYAIYEEQSPKQVDSRE